MNEHKIGVMKRAYFDEVDNLNKLKQHKSQLRFRQDKLLMLMREIISKKYFALGFSLNIRDQVELACSNPDGLTHAFKSQPFDVLLDKRNVRFTFMPRANQIGNISYDVSRYNNGEYGYVSGELSWQKAQGSESSNWFLNVNSGGKSLSSSLFDKNGIEMLLTNMHQF